MLIAETYYSRWGRSTLSPKSLPTLAIKAGYQAIGIADRGSLAGTFSFSEAVRDANKAQAAAATAAGTEHRPLVPIIGERLPYGTPIYNGWITVHALNEVGWRNLIRLNNRYHIKHRSGILTTEDILCCSEGIFVTTGGLDGPIDRLILNDQIDLASQMLGQLAFCLGDRFAVAFERNDAMGPAELARESLLAELAQREGVAGLALPSVRHVGDSDRVALDVLIYNAEKQGIPIRHPAFRGATHGSHFRERDDLVALYRDTPMLWENLDALTAACQFSVKKVDAQLPSAGWAADEVATIIDRAHLGLEERLRKIPEDADEQTYRDRLEVELSYITKLKFSGYFLIVADFIAWCRDVGIPVGPGRGSGAGSLVAWSLGITDIDPLRWGLLFERFINPDRVSLPDFDIDLCAERVEEVLDYVRDRYGNDHVAKIATYGRLKGRGAFKAAARALSIPPGLAESVAKRFPEKVGDKLKETTVAKGQADIIEIMAGNAEIAGAIEIAEILEGAINMVSQHAAGVVIADPNLFDVTPLMDVPNAGRVSHYDMKSIEPTGLVKFDFLKLSTLTIIQKAWERIKARHPQPKIDIENLSYEDEGVYRMMNEGRTLRLFQIEQPGMTRSLIQIQPSRFEDLIALVSLYRPGPMDQIPLYADRKAGRASVEYPHPALAEVLQETHGIIIYQEQVMKVAQLLSSYTLGEADLLRRAMGKKIKAEMDAQRERFESGCEKNGITKQKAKEIFDLLAKFAEYGFNKSHAAAYAQICWVTACLKYHYTLEFACANLDHDAEETEKVAQMVRECERMGLKVLGPDINRSQVTFEIEDGAIRYGFAALTGMSHATATSIVTARTKGPFLSASDAIVRLFDQGLTKKQVETLINAGAFDTLLDHSTAEIRYDLVQGVNQMGSVKKAESGPSLLDALEIKNETIIDAMRRDRLGAIKKGRGASQPVRNRTGEQSLTAEVNREIEALGFRLHRHPAIEHIMLAYRINASPIKSLAKADVDTVVTLIAQVEGIYPVKERRPAEIGSDGVEIVLSDQTGRTTIYAASPDNLPPQGEIAVIRIETRRTGKIMKDWELPTAADRAAPAAIILTIDKSQASEGATALTEAIKDGVRTHGRNGQHRLILFFPGNDGEGMEIRTPIARVNPTPALNAHLEKVPGITLITIKNQGEIGVPVPKNAEPVTATSFTQNAGYDTLF